MAYRLKASDYVKNCPISDNAYFTFAKRIMAVVRGPNCELMLQAFNKYLEGDRLTYADELDEHLTCTFEILRFEIDKAIERSTRARALAKKRHHRRQKQHTTVHKATASGPKKPVKEDAVQKPQIMSAADGLPVPVSCLPEFDATEPTPPTVSSRRMRRAAAHAVRPRYKWQKIG